MKTAVDALTNLSLDPEAQRIAWERDRNERGWRHMMGSAHQEGQRTGKAATLARQLAKKVGPLSAEQRARIEAADEATLDRWSGRLELEAGSADGDPGRGGEVSVGVGRARPGKRMPACAPPGTRCPTGAGGGPRRQDQTRRPDRAHEIGGRLREEGARLEVEPGLRAENRRRVHVGGPEDAAVRREEIDAGGRSGAVREERIGRRRRRAGGVPAEDLVEEHEADFVVRIEGEAALGPVVGVRVAGGVADLDLRHKAPIHLGNSLRP
ncbi:hypothetical protein OUZ56_032511 [Daphnia magna]|uniref:Uncharacterized protein n=1 Tax=Daphnia magna TaxID=35525 RepID=A0ABR0B943_9CRUS|nr:hypothetical protein OUZ56_032511 [Daphnia magna]